MAVCVCFCFNLTLSSVTRPCRGERGLSTYVILLLFFSPLLFSFISIGGTAGTAGSNQQEQSKYVKKVTTKTGHDSNKKEENQPHTNTHKVYRRKGKKHVRICVCIFVVFLFGWFHSRDQHLIGALGPRTAITEPVLYTSLVYIVRQTWHRRASQQQATQPVSGRISSGGGAVVYVMKYGIVTDTTALRQQPSRRVIKTPLPTMLYRIATRTSHPASHTHIYV